MILRYTTGLDCIRHWRNYLVVGPAEHVARIVGPCARVAALALPLLAAADVPPPPPVWGQEWAGYGLGATGVSEIPTPFGEGYATGLGGIAAGRARLTAGEVPVAVPANAYAPQGADFGWGAPFRLPADSPHHPASLNAASRSVHSDASWANLAPRQIEQVRPELPNYPEALVPPPGVDKAPLPWTASLSPAQAAYVADAVQAHALPPERVVVPEPGSVVLMAVAAVLAVAMRRRG